MIAIAMETRRVVLQGRCLHGAYLSRSIDDGRKQRRARQPDCGQRVPVCVQDAAHPRHLWVARVAVEREAMVCGGGGRQDGAKAICRILLICIVVLKHPSHC